MTRKELDSVASALYERVSNGTYTTLEEMVGVLVSIYKYGWDDSVEHMKIFRSFCYKEELDLTNDLLNKKDKDAEFKRLSVLAQAYENLWTYLEKEIDKK